MIIKRGNIDGLIVPKPRTIISPSGTGLLRKAASTTVPPSTILTDNFTDADNTALTSHTPDEITGSGAWVGNSNVYKILNNQVIRAAESRYDNTIALLYSGTVTYKFMVGITSSPGVSSGIKIRQDGGNFICARVYSSAGKYYVSLDKYVNNVPNSTIAYLGNITGTFSQMVPVKVVDTGTNLKLYFDVSGTEATTLRIDVDNAEYAGMLGMGVLLDTIDGTYPRLDTLVVT